MDASEKKLIDLIRIIAHESLVEVEVYLSQNPFEKHVERSAKKAALKLSDKKSEKSLTLLIYLNLWTKKYCLLISPEIFTKLEPSYWEEIQRLFNLDLLGTHYRNALTLFLQTLRPSLSKHFSPQH